MRKELYSEYGGISPIWFTLNKPLSLKSVCLEYKNKNCISYNMYKIIKKLATAQWIVIFHFIERQIFPWHNKHFFDNIKNWYCTLIIFSQLAILTGREIKFWEKIMWFNKITFLFSLLWLAHILETINFFCYLFAENSQQLTYRHYIRMTASLMHCWHNFSVYYKCTFHKCWHMWPMKW